MSKKKWHENIPEKGVLCKDSNGSIVRIMGKSKFDGMVVDDCVSQTDFDIDELTPLTAAEWWKLAPWQDMKDAPRDGSRVLLLSVIGRIEIGYFYNNCWHDLGNSRLDAKFWLPLPQVSK